MKFPTVVLSILFLVCGASSYQSNKYQYTYDDQEKYDHEKYDQEKSSRKDLYQSGSGSGVQQGRTFFPQKEKFLADASFHLGHALKGGIGGGFGLGGLGYGHGGFGGYGGFGHHHHGYGYRGYYGRPYYGYGGGYYGYRNNILHPGFHHFGYPYSFYKK